jgi:hypothetical protein
MRHFGDLPSRMTIEVVEANGSSPANPAVLKHQPIGAFDPILGGGGLDDFGWILNLKKLHPANSLVVDLAKTRPEIQIGNGVYYFHTAQRKDGPIPLKQNGVEKGPLAGIASIVGANVYLDATTKLVLKWTNEAGTSMTLPLEKPIDNNSSHEIYINNSPLFENPSSATHSELSEYYGVITGVPPGERFNLEFPKFIDDSPEFTNSIDFLESTSKFDTKKGTPRIPCMPIVIEG